MYTKSMQSIIKSQHVHKLITLSPGKDTELDAVLRCTTCGRIMLAEHDEETGGSISSHQCPPKTFN